MSNKQYAERDAYELDVAGGYYSRHVSAMTSEGLHSKSDIAAELGHRDMVIAELQQKYDACFKALEDATNDCMNLQYRLNKALGETK